MTAAPAVTSVRPPAGPMSPAQRRNVGVLGVDMALFAMGLGALGQLTIIPLFVSKLTDNPLAVGAVTAAFQIGWLPQVFAAGLVERSVRKWPWVIWFSSFERLASLVLVLCALALPHTGAWILAFVYLACFSQTMFAGLCVGPWLDVIARSVPGRLRGRFFGISNMAGALLGAISAAIAVPLLNYFPFPYNFAACFGLATFIYAIGMIPLCMVREPPGPPPRPPRPFKSQLADLPRLLASDRPFRSFLIGLSIVSFATMSNGFVAVYAVSVLGAPDEIAGWYTATLFIAQTVASLFLGWLGDRFGFLFIGRSVVFATISMCLVALVVPDPVWLLVGFALLGIVQSGSMLARMTGSTEYGPPERRPSYVALAFGIVGPSAAIAPLLGGQIVAVLGYPWLFGISAAVALLALPFLGDRARPPARPADA